MIKAGLFPDMLSCVEYKAPEISREGIDLRGDIWMCARSSNAMDIAADGSLREI